VSAELVRGRSIFAALAALASCSGPPGDLRAVDARPDPTDAEARPPDAALPTGTPDLTVHAARAEIDLAVAETLFTLDACELLAEEDCVVAPGERRLLHFAVETPNLGDGDLFIGRPDSENPNIQYSDCHRHYHLEGYAAYRLVDQESKEVAVGRKQAFCLLDSRRWLTGDPSVAASARYTCQFQGIQRGWADVYHTRLPCQFIDITDVPDGSYQLEIEINPTGVIEELDYGNNLASIPVELGEPAPEGPPALEGPTEPCPDDLDPSATTGLHRECGWTFAGLFDCPAGTTARLGCSAACALGSCSGDPMIRVCDAARADGNCSFPAAAGVGESDDFSRDPCPCDRTVECPDSGRVVVYTAPSRLGEAYGCDLGYLGMSPVPE
jgi:hypothetical protein